MNGSCPALPFLPALRELAAGLCPGHSSLFLKGVVNILGSNIGSGASRSVWVWGDCVVKVRNSGAAPDANRREWQAYEAALLAEPVLARFLPETHYVSLPNGHDLVVMRRADSIFDEAARKAGVYNYPTGLVFDALQKRKILNDDAYDVYEMLCWLFSDTHFGNLGIFGGHLMLIDMGAGFLPFNLDEARFRFGHLFQPCEVGV